MTRSVLALTAIAALILGGCSGSPGGPTINHKLNPEPTASPGGSAGGSAGASSVVSADILAREPVANTATVKHILISWHDLADAFGGHLDSRAEKRSKADAEAEVRSLVKQLQDGADFDTVMKAHSEDLGSAVSGRAFTVTPDAQLVIEFRQLSLRLKPGEFGVCQSDFGFHIIKRIT
jgi:parvulin-like peptidyl-prolyl cis-trans isomerase-like protein